MSGSVVLLSKLPSKQDVCILSKWGCTMTSSFTFQWKLPFSEVAESLRSRFHLRTHSWEHHYMLYSAIKSSYFYCCKRQRLAEMSFAQPLNQFSGTQPVKLHGKLAAWAPRSCWVECVWQTKIRHGHMVIPVNCGNSAISSQLYSCIQLVALTMISLNTVIWVYFAKCFFKKSSEMCKCYLFLTHNS